MYIVFFDYVGKTYFFGYLPKVGTTRFTPEIAEARRNLDELNQSREKPAPGNAATRASFVQALVRREIDIADDGSVESRNHFPETLIVEFRLGQPADPARGEPSQEKSHFMTFESKSQKFHSRDPSLEIAIYNAKLLHELAKLDPSKWAEDAEEGNYPDGP